MEEKDYISLKWGTLKAWNIQSEKAKKVLRKYQSLGTSISAMTQNDTHEQKDLICELIDASNVDTIYLDWDGIDISKEEAKKYVRDYK